jgi:DNA repair protein RadC
MPSKRYRLKLATWIVVREAEEPSPRKINHPEDAARLAMELVRASDDDKEHFWVVLLNQKHHYLMHTEVSMGNQNASLVHPREVLCAVTARAISLPQAG